MRPRQLIRGMMIICLAMKMVSTSGPLAVLSTPSSALRCRFPFQGTWYRPLPRQTLRGRLPGLSTRRRETAGHPLGRATSAWQSTRTRSFSATIEGSPTPCCPATRTPGSPRCRGSMQDPASRCRVPAATT
jgi:hypothetical protein